MIGLQVSLLITDSQSVTIDILNFGKLYFDAIYSTNVNIER